MNDCSGNLQGASVALLHDLFAELESRGVAYVVIHGREKIRRGRLSDVDMAFDRCPTEVIPAIIEEFQADRDLLLVQQLHYDVPHCYYFVIAIKTAAGIEYLQLDCIYDTSGLNRYWIKSSDLIANRRRDKGIWAPSPQLELQYLLIKKALKGSMSDAAFEWIQRHNSYELGNLDRQERDQGRDIRRIFREILDAKNSEQATAGLKAVRRRLRRKTLLAPVRLAARVLLQLTRILKRSRQKTGIFVVLLGTDGAGKSTLATAICDGCGRGFRRIWRFHWRPHVFPKLGRGNAGGTAAPQAPAVSSKYGPAVSFARFGYYWLDFVIGGWVLVGVWLRRSGLVLAERYYFDFLVHPARYAFSLPPWVFWVGALAVRKPDLAVLLTGDPQAIWKRKQELPLDEVKRQIGAYHELASRMPRALVVNTDIGVSQTVQRVTWELLSVVSKRSSGLKP